MAPRTKTPFPPPPRRWLPADFDPGDEEALRRAVAHLAGRDLAAPEALQEWILDLDELEAALENLQSRRSIAATRDTRDEAAHAAWLDAQTRIAPLARTLLDGLDRVYLASPARARLEPARWGLYDRVKANRAALYREANVRRVADEAVLKQQYEQRMGRLVVTFRGEEHTPQALGRWMDATDRGLREQAWLALERARLDCADEVSDLFDRIVRLRHEIATEAGFANYLDYRFRELERFDYTPHDCEAFHDAVEEHVVPVAVELRERRRRALGLQVLRPWDLSVDPEGRAPLRLFRTGAELEDICQKAFEQVAPDLGEQFRFLRAQQLLDVENRPGKAPGGYQAQLHDRRLPFIFANAVGLVGDVRTLLHEGGHAFHALACRDQPVLRYRRGPIEFNEVASMGMELLAADRLEAAIAPDDAERVRADLLRHAIELLPWVATVDAFQHWVYSYPEHGRSERAAYWASLRQRFEPDVDWSGHETWLSQEWQRQLHLFKVPLYYVEYGIAQVGALQLWLNMRKQGGRALTAWRSALALGGSRPLPELFTTAHLCFDFGPAMLATLSRAVREELLADAEPAVAAE